MTCSTADKILEEQGAVGESEGGKLMSMVTLPDID